MKKNIDDIFKDGLSTHSEVPPPRIWDSVSSEIVAAPSKSRYIGVWRYVAAAIFVGVLFLSSVLFLDLDKNLNTEEFSSLSEEIEQQIINRELLVTEKANDEIYHSKTKNESESSKSDLFSSNLSSIIDKSDEDKECKTVDERTNKVVSAPVEKEVNSVTVKDKEIPDFTTVDPSGIGEEELPTEVFIKSEPEYGSQKSATTQEYTPFHAEPALYNSTKAKSKYIVTLSGQVAPGYSDKEVSGSSNPASRESGMSTLSGGLNINVKSNKKWSIETGVYYSQTGQNFSNDVYSQGYPSMAPPSMDEPYSNVTEMSLNNSMGKIKLENLPLYKGSSSSMQGIAMPSSSDGPSSSTLIGTVDIQQQLEFVEVPLLVRYHIVDRGVNVSLAGGMSTNFLVDNNVYHLDGGSRTWIGETEQINTINYSAVVGFGLQVPLWNSVLFNFEPRVKYFMNSVSSDPSTYYKPYSVGVFTGVSYRF